MEKHFKNLTKTLFFIINLIFYRTSLGIPTNDKGFYILIISIILTGRLDYILLNLYPKKNYKYTVVGLIVFLKIGLSIYFREFHSFDIFGRLGLAREAGGVLPVIFKDFSPAYFLMILAGLGLAYLTKKYYWEEAFTKKRFYKDLGVFFAILILPGLFIRPLRGTEVYTSTFLSPLYTRVEARQDAKSLEKTDIKKYFSFRDFKSNEYTGLAEDKNIIFIQCESLQNAVINRTYNGEEVTPFLNSLVKKMGSIYFDNYFELLGFGNTSDAEFVSMTSVYPTLEGQAYSVYKNNKTYGLPKIAKKMGYETMAMHGNTGKFYNRQEIYKNFDFDRIYLGETYDQTDQLMMGLSDKSFFDQSFDKIKKVDDEGKKFFALMVTLTTHTPYNLPENLREIPKEADDKTDFVYDYISCARYTDRAMEEFFDKLEKSGILDKTVIVIYGDHHAYTLNKEKDRESMERWLGREIYYDDMMNIPLVIHVPDFNKNITRHVVGSQLDLYPTILNLMGWDRKEIPTFGIDLLGWGKEVENNAVYPQTYLLKGSYITWDQVFEYSRDGVFENSRLIDRNTRKPLPLDEARKESDWAKTCIDYSNNLMTNDNLIELVEKNKED